VKNQNVRVARDDVLARVKEMLVETPLTTEELNRFLAWRETRTTQHPTTSKEEKERKEAEEKKKWSKPSEQRFRKKNIPNKNKKPGRPKNSFAVANAPSALAPKTRYASTFESTRRAKLRLVGPVKRRFTPTTSSRGMPQPKDQE